MAQQARMAVTEVSFPFPLPVASGGRQASEVALSEEMLPTGNAALDAALGGGLARRRTHLLTGTRGSGAVAVLHLLLAAMTPTAPVFLFDPRRRFYPPAARAAGAHLPHLLLVRGDYARDGDRALAAVLRTGACPLVVWDADTLPPASFLDRLRPLVRAGGCALLLVTADHAPAASPADGATLAVSHRRWSHRPDGTACDGRTLTVAVTDHRRGRVTSVPLAVSFPQPLPPLLHSMGKGGAADANAARGGDLGAGATVAGLRAG